METPQVMTADAVKMIRLYVCALAACECVVYGGRSRVSIRSSSSSSSSGDVSQQRSADDRQQGIFTSPNHPQIYPTNVNCILYTFIASPQQIVEITFSDFNLQIPPTSKSEYILFPVNMLNMLTVRRQLSTLNSLASYGVNSLPLSSFQFGYIISTSNLTSITHPDFRFSTYVVPNILL